jgi:N-methylhydantoinase A
VFSETRTRYGLLSAEHGPALSALFAEMEQRLAERAGAGRPDATIVRTFDGRLAGQGWETPFIPVPAGPLDGAAIAGLITAFHDEYHRRNGRRFEMMPVEGVTYRVQLVLPTSKMRYPRHAPADHPAGPPQASGPRTLRYLYDGDRAAACYERACLGAGDVLEGPAIVLEEAATTFVPASRRAVVGAHGELVIAR